MNTQYSKRLLFPTETLSHNLVPTLTAENNCIPYLKSKFSTYRTLISEYFKTVKRPKSAFVPNYIFLFKYLPYFAFYL